MSYTRSDAFRLLRRSHEGKRLAHAYLITGPEGSGKRALAEDLARMVTGGETGFGDPDVHTAEPESKSRRLSIEQTRALERELQMRARGPDRRKVAVLFDADRMTPPAANSFLKTLEEPPNNSLLLLTSAQPEALPDTILSRCIAVPLRAEGREDSSLQKVQLLEALRAHFRHRTGAAADAGSRDAEIATVYRLVRKFTVLLQGAREAIAQEMETEQKEEERRYKQTTDSRDWLEEREDYYKAMVESRYLQRRSVLAETLLQWWADVLRQQGGAPAAALDLPSHAADTGALAKTFSAAEVLGRMRHLEELRENLGRNVKEDLAVEVAFLNAFH